MRSRLDADQLAAAGVTEREAEILFLVGQHLQNREIAADLVLSERTIESHVSSLLRKLGLANRRDLARVAPTTARPDQSMPTPLTSLVGRDDEIALVVELIEDERVVTVHGPPGSGKSRVALQAVTSSTRAHAARFVDLATVPPGGRVEQAFADAVGIRMPELGLERSLRSALSAGPLLLLVDNCEHVVSEVAELVNSWLSTSEDLRIIATSTLPLGIPGERLLLLAPLTSPDGDSVGAVLASAAGQLFADRAAAAAPGFAVEPGNAAPIARLCRRLDGLPLAIELAAARVRHFTPAELLAMLDQRFALLTGGPSTAQPRQRALEASLRWSYHLLTEEERLLLDRASVFTSGFDVASLAAVAMPPLDPDATIQLLPRLLDRSLVARRRVNDVSEYRLLESIRLFAADRLAERGETETVRDRVARDTLDRARSLAGELYGPRQVEALGWFDRRWPDIRSAVRHAQDAEDDAAVHGFLTAIRGWDVLGARAEAFGWLRRPEDVSTTADAAAVGALAAAADLWCYQDLQRAQQLSIQAMEAAGDNDVFRARALFSLGRSLRPTDPAAARQRLSEAEQAFISVGDRWGRALAVVDRGLAEQDLEDATAGVRRGCELLAAEGDIVLRANALVRLGLRCISERALLDRVPNWMGEAAELAREAGNTHEIAHARLGIALLDVLEDAARTNRAELDRLAEEFRRIGDQRCVARCLVGLGLLARARTDDAEFERCVEEATELTDELADPRLAAWVVRELAT